MTLTQQRELLERDLGEAGIAFTARAATGQRLEAVFRYVESHGPALPFTATVRNGALQLLLHDILPQSDAMSAAAAIRTLNAHLAIGHARWVAQRGSYQLSAGYPAFARQPGRPLLPLLIASLYSAGAALSSGSDAAWSDAREAADTIYSAYPLCDMPEAMDTIAVALAGIGHAFHQEGHTSLRQTFHEPDGNTFTVMIAPRDPRLIRVETTTKIAMDMESHKVDWLNETAPIGYFVPGDASSPMAHVWDFSPESILVTERLAAWLIEVAAQMSAAARNIPLGT